MINYRPLLLTLLLSLCSIAGLFAQLYDNNWIIGPAYLSTLNFATAPPTQTYVVDTLAIFNTNACISNQGGNFLFFTNGIYVANKNGGKMPHGDSLSFYNYHHNYEIVYPNGMPQQQGALILPRPNDTAKYILFHYSPVDTYVNIPNGGYYIPRNFYYSVIDINADNGLGDVVQKNIRLPWNGLECASRMTAVKHANGRDWWIIRHGWRNNLYIKFLFTPDTIQGPYFQNIGPAFNNNNRVVDYYGNSVFNLEGNKMATGNLYGPLVVLDFDRCNGEFSNPVSIYNKLADTTLPGVGGIAFSPNGRFVYVDNVYELNQYDLWAANPNDSVRLYTVDSTDGNYMLTMRLGPDGKIYIGTWHGGSYALHVINQPDLAGTACQFQFRGLSCPISGNTVSLPNMVNYKLGALLGSGCDTIINAIDNGQQTIDNGQIQVYPNPANEYFVVETNLINAEVSITDAQGSAIAKYKITNSKYEIDCTTWASGVYFWHLNNNTHTTSNGKFMIVH